MNWFIKFLLVLSVNITFAQQEASVWYFGHNAGLKFEDNGTVTPLYGELFTNEGCSSIADTNGNLLLYTDGMTVYDRNHLLMPNGYYAGGTGLMGDKSSTQSAIIVPKPGDPNIYYVFTIDEPHHENGAVYPNVFSGTYNDPNSGSTPTGDDGVNNGLNYSEVDLTIIGSNGSIGDVVSLNNHLVTYDLSPGGNEIKYKCSEKITAVKDTNGSDYWVITHFVDKFMAFRITSAGVNPTPVISTLMPIVPVEGYRRNSIGYMKASPNGEKIAIAHNQIVPGFGSSVIFKGAVYVYDFDASTGIVSNPELVAADVTAYGVEFSSSSEKLYTSFTIEAATGLGSSRITQFDLTSTNIPASGIMIYDNVSPGALQIAPNGKIYFSGGSNVDSLGVINDPDLPGSSCNFVPQSQPLLSGTARVLGLPPFITSFFYPTFSVENFCEGM
ncbi:MAG TPA: cell surface protein, partial [Flavobacterium sp.]